MIRKVLNKWQIILSGLILTILVIITQVGLSVFIPSDDALLMIAVQQLISKDTVNLKGYVHVPIDEDTMTDDMVLVFNDFSLLVDGTYYPEDNQGIIALKLFSETLNQSLGNISLIQYEEDLILDLNDLVGYVGRVGGSDESDWFDFGKIINDLQNNETELVFKRQGYETIDFGSKNENRYLKMVTSKKDILDDSDAYDLTLYLSSDIQVEHITLTYYQGGSVKPALISEISINQNKKLAMTIPIYDLDEMPIVTEGDYDQILNNIMNTMNLGLENQ